MKIAAITDIGSCRQENQDNYCAQQLAGGTAWGIVCDGMGGVNGGHGKDFHYARVRHHEPRRV